MARNQAMNQQSAGQPMPPMGVPGYDQQLQYQQYQQPAAVKKGGAKWLTFEYALAMFLSVGAVILLAFQTPLVFGLWFGGGAGGGTFLLQQLLLGSLPPVTAAVTTLVAATLFGVISIILFGRVTRALAERDDYTNRTAYKVVTYAAMAALVVPVLALASRLISVLINSLLFIGVKGAGAIYKGLYLAEFLPVAIAFIVALVAAFAVKQIIQGKNASLALALTATAAAAALLIATGVTMAVQQHKGTAAPAGGLQEITLPTGPGINLPGLGGDAGGGDAGLKGGNNTLPIGPSKPSFGGGSGSGSEKPKPGGLGGFELPKIPETHDGRSGLRI